jgi:hypothetical protein
MKAAERKVDPVPRTQESLLPNPDVDDAAREQWQQEIRELEARGVR